MPTSSQDVLSPQHNGEQWKTYFKYSIYVFFYNNPSFSHVCMRVSLFHCGIISLIANYSLNRLWDDTKFPAVLVRRWQRPVGLGTELGRKRIMINRLLRLLLPLLLIMMTPGSHTLHIIGIPSLRDSSSNWKP